MQRTLTLGRAAGLATGLGIAAADGLCAALVAGGFGVAADVLVVQARWLNIGAGALLTGLGLRILLVPPGATADKLSTATQRWNTVSGFLLTIFNPMALLLMAAVLTLFGVLEAGIGLRRGAMLVAGIFGGSLLWWIALV
ncbi:MAG: LysE family translocator, partial [Alphaproteobacteria bacterium]|nr:LysE family translocator [Alphaproteobacteria bacterium]